MRPKFRRTTPDQQQRLGAALTAGQLQLIQITDLTELEEFAQLASRKQFRRKRLGDGECSAIVVAHRRGYILGIDDKPAIKQTRVLFPRIVIRQTQDLMVELIHAGALTIEQADGIKTDWAAHHKFVLKEFQSFREKA